MNIEEGIKSLKASIAALEGQRAILGPQVVESAIAPLRLQLTTLQRQADEEEQQLRQVTVLFADATGFTSMCTKLEPESVARTMNTLWRPIDEAIVAQGGRITQHVGDCVMAIWGSERVREDDAECAIRAALKMQAVLARFREEHGSGLQMRIGVNTGPVRLGNVATTREYTALGDPVNTASRLEHAAPPGGILISHDTYRHVAGVFEVVPQAPLTVKGKDEPLQTYVVLRILPRAQRLGARGITGIRTRMIGRDVELAQLRARLERAVAGREGGIVSVFGEAGVGKSRLLAEFADVVRTNPHGVELMAGRCDRGLQATPYGLWRDVLSVRFGIQENDPPAEVRRKVEQGVAEMLGNFDDGARQPSRPPHSRATLSSPGFRLAGAASEPSRAEGIEMRAHLIGYLLGFDFSDSPHVRGAVGDGIQLRNRALFCLASAFRALAERGPVVVCVEDIHWADDSSLAALIQLGQTAAGHRLLFVAATRRELLKRKPDWAVDQAFHLRIDLRALSPADSGALVDDILQRVRDVPAALRERIVGQADGNPYYLEELIKMLIEDRVIVTGGQQWEIDSGRLPTLKIPPTLTAVLQARFDSLSAVEKVALQRASVIGRIFWDYALVSLVPETEGAVAMGPTHAPIDIGVLDLLRGREMIFSHPSSAFSDANEYAFKHALLRDVTYDTVLKSERPRYHELVAAWLTTHSGERAGEIAGLIAEHLEQAQRPQQAALWLGQAGEHAFQLSAFHESKAFFERGLFLLPPDHPDRLALGVRMGEVLLRLCDYAKCRELLTQCVGDARARNDLASLAAALSFLGTLELNEGHKEESRRFVAESLSVARQSQDHAGVAHALVGLGWAHNRIGNLPEARASFAEGLELFRTLGEHKGIARALGGLGVVAEKLGDYDEAKRRGLESLEIFREIGSRQGMSVVQNNLGELARSQRDYATAAACYQESLALARAIDDRRSMAIALGNIGHIATARQDLPSAQSAYLESIATAMSIQAVPWVLDALAGLAGVQVRSGRAEQALTFLGLVVFHPGLYHDTKSILEPILAELRLQLPSELVVSRLEATKQRRLEEVVAEVLSEHAQP